MEVLFMNQVKLSILFGISIALVLPVILLFVVSNNIPFFVKILYMLWEIIAVLGYNFYVTKGNSAKRPDEISKVLVKGEIEDAIIQATNMGMTEESDYYQFLLMMKDIIVKYKAYSFEVSEFVGSLQASIEDVTRSNGELAFAADSIAAGAIAQANEASESALTANTISSKIEDLAETTEHISAETKKAQEVTKNGEVSFKKLFNSIDTYAENMVSLLGNLKNLSGEAENIQDITNAISKIAKKTNLLSLNASIEAARAGAAGKGFAVVAGEIRQLSEQTQKSSNEIGDVVSRVIADLKNIGESVDGSNQIFLKQKESVADAENAFTSIDDFVKSIMVSQNSYIDDFKGLYDLKIQLADTIGSIAAVAQESAATTEEMASLTMMQNNATSSLADMASYLSSSIVKLSNVMDIFNIKVEKTKKRKIGINFIIDIDALTTIKMAADDAGKKYGYDIIVDAPKTVDSEAQIKIMERFIAEGVSGIAISPASDKLLTPIINKAIEAGIKVICINSDAPSSKRLGLMDTNPLNGGKISGEVAAKHMGGKGKIMYTAFNDTIGTDVHRSTGFVKVLNKFPDIELVPIPLPDNALNAFTTDVTKYIDKAVKENPDFEMLYVINETWGDVVSVYFEKMGINKKLMSFGGSKTLIKAIKEDREVVVISQRQFVWGEKLVKWINDAFNGKPVPTYEDTGVFEINKSNYKIFEHYF